MKRLGVTLIEALVVITILAILLGLFLPAIVTLRRNAHQTHARHQLKELSLATHNYISIHSGQLPASGNFLRHGSFHMNLLPLLSGGHPESIQHGHYQIIKAYISPIDPSLSFYTEERRGKGNCSYAANAVLFVQGSRVEHVADGLSNTISLVERYARCNLSDTNWSLHNMYCEDIHNRPVVCSPTPIRMGTFADATTGDARPIRVNGETRCSQRGVTFQVHVSPDRCDPLQVQAAHATGLLAAYADGSVKLVSPTIAESPFWSQVTPHGGEILAAP